MPPSVSAQFSVLVIDDDPLALDLIRALLTSALPVSVLTSDDPESGLELVRLHRPQVLLVDYRMPKMDGMAVIGRALEIEPDLYAILMTAHYSTESAVTAIQGGACDYFEKPLAPERLIERIESILSVLRRRLTADALELQLVNAAQFEGMIGRSPEMLTVFSRIRHVAPHYRTALVTGPTGTGKELVAHALHKQSPASAAPFAVLNCSAVVETLFESEMFGHVKGAFTGAVQDKTGVFEYAHGGTVFLDEIGELPLSMQAKLLRVLQQQEIQRVGSPQPRKVDVRIVAATNRDLRKMVREGRFREDLFYRLSMVEVKIPPLHKRGEDVPLLLRFMLNKYSKLYGKPIQKLTLRCQQVLQRYDWPGNVREVENVIGSACMMSQGGVLDVRDLPDEIRESAGNRQTQPEESAKTFLGAEILPLYEMEKLYVQQALSRLSGNKLRTAEALRISRATLYRLLAVEKPPENGQDNDPDKEKKRQVSKAAAPGVVQ